MGRCLVTVGAIALSALVGPLVFAAGLFKIGEQAPTFTLTSITDERVSLDAYKGKVIVLGLFHICDPCMLQGSALQKVHEFTRKKPVMVIGVNSSGNSKKDVSDFLSAFPVKVAYHYLLDPNKITDKLYGGGKFIPNVYVIDQNGVIRWQRVGDMDMAGAEVILAEVDKLLAGSGNKM